MNCRVHTNKTEEMHCQSTLCQTQKRVLSEHCVRSRYRQSTLCPTQKHVLSKHCQKHVLSEHRQKQALSENFIRETHFQFLTTFKPWAYIFFFNTDFQGLLRPCERAFKTQGLSSTLTDCLNPGTCVHHLFITQPSTSQTHSKHVFAVRSRYCQSTV